MYEFRQINPRQLSKERIRQLLSYGDISRITQMTNYHYQHVSRVIREGRENDAIWRAAVEYLDSLPDVKISARLAKALTKKNKLKE